MGKGSIDAALGAGRYSVTVRKDSTRVDALKTKLSAQVATLDATVIPAAETAVTDAVADLTSKTSALNVWITAKNEEEIKKATKAMQAAEELVTSVRRYLALIKLKREQAAKQNQWLTDNTPSDEQVSAWCADYNFDMTGDKRLIYPDNDPAETPIIAPGGDSGVASDYLPAHGARQPIVTSTPAGAWINRALMPAWQKNIAPTYRVATINALDLSADTASVTLLAAKSRYQSIDINPETATLNAVPVEYMSCNAAAFQVGDTVIVEYQGNNLTNPRVIGFLNNPKPCAYSYPVWFEFDTGSTEEHFATLDSSQWKEDPVGYTVPAIEGFYTSYRHYWYDITGTIQLMYFSERPHRGIETPNALSNSPGTGRVIYHGETAYRHTGYIQSGAVTTNTPGNVPWIIVVGSGYGAAPGTPYSVNFYAKPLNCSAPANTGSTTTMEEDIFDAVNNSKWRHLGEVELYADKVAAFGFDRSLPCMLPQWHFNGSGTKCITATWFQGSEPELIPNDPPPENQRNRSYVFEISVGGVGTTSPLVSIAEIDKGPGYRSYTRSGDVEYPAVNPYSGHLTLNTGFCIAADYQGDTPTFITVSGGGTINTSGDYGFEVINAYTIGAYTFNDFAWHVSGTASGEIVEEVFWDGVKLGNYFELTEETNGYWGGQSFMMHSTQPGEYHETSHTGSSARVESLPYLLEVDARVGLLSLVRHRKEKNITPVPHSGGGVPSMTVDSSETWTIETVLGAATLHTIELKRNDANYQTLAMEGTYTGFLWADGRMTTRAVHQFWGRYFEFQTLLTWVAYNAAEPEWDTSVIYDRVVYPATDHFSVIEPGLGIDVTSLSMLRDASTLLACVVNYNTADITSSYGETNLYIAPDGTYRDELDVPKATLNQMFDVADFPGCRLTDFHCAVYEPA